eukprot:758337-Hanusia_phi.AAC.2
MSARAKMVGRARWLIAPPPLAFSLRHLQHPSHSSSRASKAVEMDTAAAPLKPCSKTMHTFYLLGGNLKITTTRDKWLEVM